MTTNQEYWDAALTRYTTKDWVDKPTIFAEQITQYLPTNGQLLELASGQGQDARYFARLGYKVTATDLIDTGLKEAAQKAKAESLTITFQTVDLANSLPFSNNSFDIIYSHLGLHYFNKADTKKLFTEIHRVLKPDGILAALFNTTEDPEINTPDFEKIEENYYREVAFDFPKRYFSIPETQEFIRDTFEPLLLDNYGETYKDEIKTLIRLVAKKI